MTASTYDDMTNENVFLESIRRLHTACMAPWHRVLLSRDVLKTALAIGKIKALSDAAIRELRAKMSICHAKCELRDDCFKDTLNDARGVRDSLLELQEAIDGKLLKFACNKMVDDVVVNWDDFVEDLAVSEDAEFNVLASKLSNIVNATRQ